MRLIVQIPCLNEAGTLARVVAGIPREIPGIDRIEILIVDDGSTDGTGELARSLGVDHVIRHAGNRGLARSFQRGIQACLALDADLIVNTDGDGQYEGADIAALVAPLVDGEADIVVGNRGGLANGHFSLGKRWLQVIGSRIIGYAAGLDIADAVSGFRAMTREAAEQIHVISDFSYTIEMLMQASAKRLKVVNVPVRTHPHARASRLFTSIPQFLRLSGITLLRTYTMYRPLRVFLLLGSVPMALGSLAILRFVYFALTGDSSGHIQSLVLGGTLAVLGMITWLIGLVADLISANRKLTEITLQRLDRVERLLKSGNASAVARPAELSVVAEKSIARRSAR